MLPSKLRRFGLEVLWSLDRGFSTMASRSVSGKEGSAKAMVTEQISQAIISTSNLIHLMQQSSPAQVEFELERLHLENDNLAQLSKLPRNLFSKASMVKNTGQVFDQLPRVISSLDAHMDHGLQSVPHLKTVNQLLENIGTNLLKPLSQSHIPEVVQELNQTPEPH